MLTGRPSLGWSTANSSEHHAALLQQKGPGQKTREMGSWCDMVQTRHARFPQEQCAWNQAGNPTTRRAEPAAFQVAEFRGICPVATCEPRDHRTSHTRRRSLTPPCLPAGGQQFCGPQSRPAVAPRRALARKPRLVTCRVSRALDADSARKCALRRCLQTCALVSRWSEAQVTTGARVAHARRSRTSTPRQPGRVNVQTLSRGANARNPVRHARDGRHGCEPRFADVRRGAVFQNPPACKQHQPGRSQPDHRP